MCHGIFNDHRESGPWFNISSKIQCFLTVQCTRHYTGVLGTTQTTGWAPPAGFTNTSSNSNLVFPRGLPSRYWPGSTLLSSSGWPVLGCRVIWLWLCYKKMRTKIHITNLFYFQIGYIQNSDQVTTWCRWRKTFLDSLLQNTPKWLNNIQIW